MFDRYFRKSKDAQKAKNELNDQDFEHKGLKLKLIVENFDYDKVEKVKIEHFQREMMGPRGGFGNMRGFPPHGNRGGRGRGRGFPRGGPHSQIPQNKGMDRQDIAYQQMMQLNANLNQQMPNMDSPYMQNDNNMIKITVEGEHLLDTIKEKHK